jgi:hypothetical protein
MGVGVAVAGAGAAVAIAAPLALVGLLTVAATAATATAPSPVTLGPGVPEAYRADLLAAYQRCPRLTPALLGAQIDVASDWNPDATSPDGGRGLAQFTPHTWALWGGDHDEDTTNGPQDPGDALRAHADYMCHLLDTMIGADLGDGDPLAVIALALAAWHTSPRAVLAAGGVPDDPDTRAYVRSVLELAASDRYTLGISPDPDPGRADVPAGGVDALLPAGYRNGRTASQAVAYALTQVGQWRDSGYCLRFVGRVVYQRPWDGASIDRAHQVWDNAPASMRHARDFDAPRGAIILWSSAIGRGAGHIAISLGSGQMVTTTGGAITIRPIKGYSDRAYLGWMPPYLRSRP